MISLGKHDILLFQGDSITHGGRMFSTWDQNHLIGHGYQDYVAQTLGVDNLASFPEILNRAESGDTIEKIRRRAEADVFALKPTVLSILIGTNDASEYQRGNEGCSPAQYETDLRWIFDRTREITPDLRIIICEPFRYIVGDETEEARKVVADVHARAEICRRLAAEYGAVFVPFAGELDRYVSVCPTEKLVWDGVHPTCTGHGILARLWLKTVEESWKRREKLS